MNKTITKIAFVSMLSLALFSVKVSAQTFTTLGIGINPPVGTLHVHTTQGYFNDLPIRDGGTQYDYYETLFHITNPTTGTGSSDGVEELTLHVIELQKQIDKLKKGTGHE